MRAHTYMVIDVIDMDSLAVIKPTCDRVINLKLSDLVTRITEHSIIFTDVYVSIYGVCEGSSTVFQGITIIAFILAILYGSKGCFVIRANSKVMEIVHWTDCMLSNSVMDCTTIRDCYRGLCEKLTICDLVIYIDDGIIDI